MYLENVQFGGYKLKSLIGRGGVAEVWLADQLALDREVALKVLPSELVSGEDAEFAERFKREAQAIGRLDHPGILPVFDYGEADGYLYLVMPYARGGNLRSRVRKAPLSRPEVFHIFENIVAGAAHAHSHGIIHRDLKPANILLHEDGRAYIGDFGIAKTMDNSTAMTQAGLILGSPSYMAPEQFMGWADYRSDLYSLGLILFFMLTGRKLYSGRLPFEIGSRHLNDPIPLPDPQVPPDLEPFLRKALAKKPQDRFQSAQEMLQAFIALEAHPAPAQTPASFESPTTVLPAALRATDEARWLREKSAAPMPASSSEETRWIQEKGAIPAPSAPTRSPEEARWIQEKGAVPAPSQETRWSQERSGPPAPSTAPSPQEARWLQEKNGAATPPPGPVNRDNTYERYSREKAYPAAPVPGPQRPNPTPADEARWRQEVGPSPSPDEARWLQEKGGPVPVATPPQPAWPPSAPGQYATPPQGITYGQPGQPPALPKPPVKSQRKQPIWLLVAIGVLVIGIIAVAGALWLNMGARSATPTVQANQATATSSAGTTAGVVTNTNNPTTASTGTTPAAQTTVPATTPPVQTTSAGVSVNGTVGTPPTSAATGSGAIPLSGHAGPVNSVSWSADGRFYLTASDDKTLKIWDAATNKVIKTLNDQANPNTDRVLSAVFSADGEYVVASAADKSTRFYSVKDGIVLITARGDLTAPAAISPDQALIPYIGAKTIRTWDYKKDTDGPEFPYFDSKVSGLAPTALAFSPDNATLAVGLNNGRIILYQVASGLPLLVVEPALNVKNSVRSLAWSPGGTLLAVAREKSFETLSIDFKSKLASATAVGQTLSAPAGGLTFSADGKRLAVSSQNGELQIWSFDNNLLLNRISTGPNPIIGLHWSQNNQQITVATGGGSPALNIFATQPTTRSLKVVLNPQNGTKVTGNALATELPGGLVRITLNVEGLEPGQHKVHIHAGSCANQGDIKFDLETLRATADGKATSTTVIKVDYTTLTTGSFYFNVHNDPGTDTYIASCGEIHV